MESKPIREDWVQPLHLQDEMIILASMQKEIGAWPLRGRETIVFLSVKVPQVRRNTCPQEVPLIQVKTYRPLVTVEREDQSAPRRSLR